MTDQPETIDPHAVAIAAFLHAPDLSTRHTDYMMVVTTAFRLGTAERVAALSAEGNDPEKDTAGNQRFEIAVNAWQAAFHHAAPERVENVARRQHRTLSHEQFNDSPAAGRHPEPRTPEYPEQLFHTPNRNNFHLEYKKKKPCAQAAGVKKPVATVIGRKKTRYMPPEDKRSRESFCSISAE